MSACSPRQPGCPALGQSEEPQRDLCAPPCPCPSAAVCPLPTAWLKLGQLQRLSCTLVLSRANRTVLRVWVWAFSRTGNLSAACWRQLWTVAASCSTIVCLPGFPSCGFTACLLVPLLIYLPHTGGDELEGGRDPLQLTGDELGAWQELAA